ncbi:MAG: hypothetical protein ACOCQE_04285 [Halanaerobium sp.]
MEKKKLAIPVFFSVAFVWFTTHFGGGFASGRQAAEFFVRHGWYSVFTPLAAMGIDAVIFYYAWDFSVINNTYDYRSWTDEFYHPYEKIFSNLYEIIFVLTMAVATAVAFATGGSTIKSAVGTAYLPNTIAIAAVIFLLTIFGAKIVRKAATYVGIAIIIGVVFVYGANAIVSFPQIIAVISDQTAKTNVWSALWSMLLYASFQAIAVGAYVAVADVLETREDALKAAWAGFIINGVLLTLASLTVLAYYPDILEIPVPTIYVVNNGVGGALAENIISILIVLGVVSTGVNFVFGGVKRIISWWPNDNTGHSHSVIASLVFVIATWSIARFGLIPLVAKGYGFLGYLGIPVLIIPVFYKLLKRKFD